MKHFYQTVPGWFFSEDVFADAVRCAPDGAHFVEVGSWKGKSSSFMAVEIANSGKNIRFDCVDHWLGSPNEQEHQDDPDVRNGELFDTFKRNIFPVSKYINPIKGDSLAVASQYKDGSLDFIFIDGAHDYESVKADIAAWLPKLKLDGIMCGDDFVSSWMEVVRAVSDAFGNAVQVFGTTWVVDRRKHTRNHTYDIILRTHSGSDIHDGKRFAGGSKTEVIVRCLSSLVDSMNHVEGDIRLIVIDDHSSVECRESIRVLLSRSRHPTNFISLEGTGNAASLKACYEYARDYGRDVIYFVEDDYLHFPSAISEMIEAYEEFRKNLGREVGVFPVDYPDRYTPSNLQESMLVLGKHRHWRTVFNSTLTFMISRLMIFHCWSAYEEMWRSGTDFVDEDTTVNRVWRAGIELFSPIPSLAVHVQFPGQEPPFTDWRKIWDSVYYP